MPTPQEIIRTNQAGKEVLLKSLQTVLYPTTTKQNFPILSSLQITSVDNKLKFVTTDLDITTITFQEANIIEKGKVVIPMKRFISILEGMIFAKLMHSLGIRATTFPLTEITGLSA